MTATAQRNWTTEAPPERDRARDPHHVSSTVPSDYRKVKGWGVDLDPRNRPMFPRELPSTVKNVRGDVRDWQVPHTRVHMSVEHPNLTPVFGASVPPQGLSGIMRDYAYRFGEGTNRHWMTLLWADRVNMIETMIADALRGRGDNLPREYGWSADAKYEDSRKPYFAAGAFLLGAIAIGLAARRALADDE